MKKKTGNTKAKLAVIAFAIIFVILYAIIYIVPRVTDVFTPTYTAEYGTLNASQEERCIFVRNEQVYNADAAGTVERKAAEGDLLRIGGLVLTLNGNQKYCQMRGLVSYYYDGFEGRVNPENMEQLTDGFFAEFEAAGGVKEMPAENVEAGSALFKIIDNKEWFLVFWTEKEDLERFPAGGSVKVDFDSKSEVEMRVRSAEEQGDSCRVILSCNRSYADFDKYRVKNCTIITSSVSGIILESDSITEKDGVKGVYVENKLDETVFVPVNILGSYGGKTAVEKNYFYDSEGNYVDTVQNYDEILKKAGGE